ncbi:hypothetical protein [Ferrimicrobium sp.]|uniref:hypothetical protein n=1 Tax=Ferrimicrobium sp. TaxID=2926050 RepID=UPI002602F125|nr:hypothetical protein [Ferrimicrobium sp.]
MRFTEFNLGHRMTRRGSMQLESIGQSVSGQSARRSEVLSAYLMSERNAKGC